MLAPAEHLASVGTLVAYIDNFVDSVISSGMVDVDLPKIPNQHSPAHLACGLMVSIAAMAIGIIGKQSHYSDADVVGFVQLSGLDSTTTVHVLGQLTILSPCLLSKNRPGCQFVPWNCSQRLYFC